MDTRLTENFWLSEFTRSDTAQRLEIANEPNEYQLANIKRNAYHMQQVRGLLGGKIIHVLSGLRTEELEKVIARSGYAAWCRRHGKIAFDESGGFGKAWNEYFARKQHPKGLATDWVCPGYGSPLDCARAVEASGLPYDQLIYEYTWVHTSWAAEDEVPRRQALTLKDGGYVPGIVG